MGELLKCGAILTADKGFSGNKQCGVSSIYIGPSFPENSNEHWKDEQPHAYVSGTGQRYNFKSGWIQTWDQHVEDNETVFMNIREGIPGKMLIECELKLYSEVF
jgi:hypothetical protein